MSPTTRAAVRAAQAETLAEAAQFKAPTLRRSTLVRVEEAQKERERTEQVRMPPLTDPLRVPLCIPVTRNGLLVLFVLERCQAI